MVIYKKRCAIAAIFAMGALEPVEAVRRKVKLVTQQDSTAQYSQVGGRRNSSSSRKSDKKKHQRGRSLSREESSKNNRKPRSLSRKNT